MKNLLFKNNQRAFTLVELMVSIAIIAILTAIMTANFTQSKSKARDSKRVSDLAQLQLALESVYEKCNLYPATPLSLGAGGCVKNGTQYTLGSFTSSIPKDPTAGADYTYETSANRLDYVLKAVLENQNKTVLDYSSDVDGTPSGLNSSVDCDDTNVNNYCVQPR